jgi:hypothetical protein
VLWATYFFFCLSVLSSVLTTVSFAGVFANKELSRGIFNASAMMTVVYAAASLATGQLVG